MEVSPRIFLLTHCILSPYDLVWIDSYHSIPLLRLTNIRVGPRRPMESIPDAGSEQMADRSRDADEADMPVMVA